MPSAEPMLLSQRVVQVRLCLVGAIAIFGGSLQMVLGQPETAPRLDNINRFMGGIYLMSGVMGLWAASTIREHNTLVFLMAAAVFVGGLGRVLSISKVGLPEPHALWIAYLVPELLIPWIIVEAQVMTNRQGVGGWGEGGGWVGRMCDLPRANQKDYVSLVRIVARAIFSVFASSLPQQLSALQLMLR